VVWGASPIHHILSHCIKSISKKGKEKYYYKAPGMNPFGSHKIKSSDKYTFSAKKIRDGYWELVIDKPLPQGEYAFTMMGVGANMDMTGGMLVFAFGVD